MNADKKNEMAHDAPQPAPCPECHRPLMAADGICRTCLLREALRTETLGIKTTTTPLEPKELASAFPQFEVLECLGRGGMGVVYRARQKSLNRIVALKILAPERIDDPKFADRFAKEAELLGQMNHPGIVTIYDFGESQGHYFLVMEFVDGVNLRDLLQEGKLEPEQALAIVPKICEALEFAHARGVTHRDIKPENILLDREGTVKIADFGIASLIGEHMQEVTGTPSYMSPEGTEPEADHRSDIYALGVVFYEMLTGERPTPSLICPSVKVEVDAALDEIVLRALERSPEKRYQTAAELSRDLQTITSAAQPQSSHRLRKTALAGGSLAALATTVLIFLNKPSPPPTTHQPDEEMKLKDLKKTVEAAVVAANVTSSAIAADQPQEPQPISAKERQELKEDARKRHHKDRKRFSRQEMGELEELYQIANKNWRKDRDKAKEAMEQLVKKYKKANRTGCAMVYLGQLSYGDERDQYLEKAIKDHSDCYYLNGVQVGGWARYLRLIDLRSDGDEREAAKLEKEIRTKYKKSITHNGVRLVEILDYMEQKKE